MGVGSLQSSKSLPASCSAAWAGTIGLHALSALACLLVLTHTVVQGYVYDKVQSALDTLRTAFGKNPFQVSLNLESSRHACTCAP